MQLLEPNDYPTDNASVTLATLAASHLSVLHKKPRFADLTNHVYLDVLFAQVGVRGNQPLGDYRTQLLVTMLRSPAERHLIEHALVTRLRTH